MLRFLSGTMNDKYMAPKRIRLLKGKQREMIESSKEKLGCWEELSRFLGVGMHYVRYDLRNEKRTLPKHVFMKMNKNLNYSYSKFIIEELSSNWGQVKGSLSSPRTNPIKVEKVGKSERLAEIIGIMLGDGNLYGKQYAVRVCGHVIDDKEYLIKHVKDLFKSVFKINLREYYHTKQNELILYTYSKFVFKNLVDYGLVSGNKKLNNVRIPNWIMNNKEFAKACVRGLMDTDGSVFYHKNSVKIELSSGIPNLHDSFEKSMRSLGFNKRWSQENTNGVRRYGLYSKSDIEKYINNIGFNNMKHLQKCPDSVVA